MFCLRVSKEWVTWPTFMRTRYQWVIPYQYSWALEFLQYLQYGWARKFPDNIKCTANNSSIDFLISNAYDPSIYTLSMYQTHHRETRDTGSGSEWYLPQGSGSTHKNIWVWVFLRFFLSYIFFITENSFGRKWSGLLTFLT